MTIKPPWKSGTSESDDASAVHATVPSLVIAWTVEITRPSWKSIWNANTSATPLGLGTAGTILATYAPVPGLDHSTVPTGSAPPGSVAASITVTSADAVPAVIVTSPAARAVSTGGSSLDRLTTAGLLDVQVSPVTDCPVELSAWIGCVSPNIIVSRAGTSVLPPGTGTVKAFALLHTPFC